MHETHILTLMLIVIPICICHANNGMAEPDQWAPIHRLVGEWEGTGTGLGGSSFVRHTYEFILNGKFLHSRTFSEFEPADSNALGELHEDWGFFSYDPDESAIKFKHFLSEGYVNTYILEKPDEMSSMADTLVFTSISTEGAGGVKARLTIRFSGSDEYDMILELTRPGKDWFRCQKLNMKRSR